MDLDNLTQEQLHKLRQQLGMVDAMQPYGWSPQFSKGVHPDNPRQLMDLTLPPAKDDPRPTFFWSAEKPRTSIDLTKTTLYPRLMWNATTGQEITVRDLSAEQTMTAKGFVLTCPGTAQEPDLKAQIDAALAQLSPEDRALCIEAALQDRVGKIRALMAGLTPDELAELRGDVVAPAGETAASDPIKRGPGRPRKEESAS